MPRYDLATLMPPPLLAPPSPAEQPRVLGLRRWCMAGSGPGGRPLWQPGASPAIELRLAVATLQRGDAADNQRLATLLCLDLDGSWRLQAAAGAAGRLWLRGRTLLNDTCWWRTRHDGDPWDCGLLRDDDAGRAALARFQPRRATLMVAQRLSPISLAHAVASLQGRQQLWQHPVRLLVLNNTASRLPGSTGWATLD
jgi:hypothetical protein